MTISLITQELHDRLLEIQKEFPALTLQNEGYQYLKKRNFTEADQKAFDEVSAILQQHIQGFSEFNNFKKSKDGFVKLRFQYDWGADSNPPTTYYIGVGYMLVDELHKGFTKVIRKQNILTGKENTMRLRMNDLQFEQWQAGGKVQDVFPHLTIQEREFLISGMLPEEQDEIFNEPE